MTILDEARVELAHKTRAQIEEETAYKWAARAVAAYEQLVQSVGDPPGVGVKWMSDHHHYHDEAIEHAALADHTGAVLHAVRRWMQAQCGR